MFTKSLFKQQFSTFRIFGLRDQTVALPGILDIAGEEATRFQRSAATN